MTFDPIRVRKNLEVSVALSRRTTLSDALSDNALHGHGSGILGDALRCYIVGLFDIGRELVLKARCYLRMAIEEQEVSPRYLRGSSEALRLNDFAMCTWLIEERSDLPNLKEAVRWSEIWFADEPGKPNKTEVQLSLAHYLDAEEYQALVERYESAGLKKPKSLRHIQGEGTMAYVIARQRLGLDYTPGEIEVAIDTFFKRKIPVWLDRDGLYDTAALWMKLAFWKPGDDPIATLLKCYDYLPGVARPEDPPRTHNGPTTPN